MRTVLLLVSCFFLSSTVEASIEFDSRTMSCLNDRVSCSNVVSLSRETLPTNDPLRLPLTSLLELSDFVTFPVQPTVQFTQPDGGSSINVAVISPTLSAGTITILNPDTTWTQASAGANLSLSSTQLDTAIRAPIERVLPAGGTISLGNGEFSPLSVAAVSSDTFIASSGALTVPLPASLNILLIGLAFMLFSSRRSPAHKVAF